MRFADGIKLMLAGDVMTGRGIDQILRRPGAPRLHEPYVRDARDYVRLAERVHGPIPAPVPPEYPWGDALAGIARAAPDLRLVNLETAVTSSDDAWPDKGIHYRMHPANVDCLGAARIDCCALANNHVLDWGRRGLHETLQTLHRAGLHTAGAGADRDEAWAPARLPLVAAGGAPGRVLVYAAATASSGVPPEWAAGQGRPGVALLPDLSESAARGLAYHVARFRGPGDRVVISIHWGGNWGFDLQPAHRDFAHRLIDLGAADVVHGHSSHHPLPIEVYRGKLILQGCGDLINDYEGIGPHRDPSGEPGHRPGDALRSDVGCLYFATIAPDSGRLRQLDIVPLQLKQFRLHAADAAARAWLERAFAAADTRMGPPLDRRLPASWSLRWGAPD